MRTFDASETALICLAMRADDLLSERDTQRGETLAWDNTVTREVLAMLTEPDDELFQGAFSGALDGEFTEDYLDADSLREGIAERIVDDIICQLPEGWTVGRDENYLPILVREDGA